MSESVRCPNCWLGPEECTERETPPYVVGGWAVVCPRCPGGVLGQAEDEATAEAELASAIREAARNVQPRGEGGGSGGGAGRKKPLGKPEPQALKPAGRPEPEQKLVGLENVDPRSEVLSLSVATQVRDWLDGLAYSKGLFISDVVRMELGEVLAAPGAPVDVWAGAKVPKTSPIGFALSKGELALIFRMAQSYGVGAKAFVHAILWRSMVSYWDKLSKPLTPESSKVATGRAVPGRRTAQSGTRVGLSGS